MPAAGTTLVYRPMPSDFLERYARVGWGGARDEFGASDRMIARWLRLRGEDECKQARRDFLQREYAEQGKSGVPGRKPILKSKAARYVAGRRLTAAIKPLETCEDGI